MPVYAYRCCFEPEIHPTTYHQWSFAEYEVFRHNVRCSVCDYAALQILSSPAFHRGIDGHFNHSLGKFVSGKRDYEDGLKEASERATLRTGVAHDFKPVDLRDKDRAGVTDEGLESTRRAEVAAGKREVKTWL